MKNTLTSLMGVALALVLSHDLALATDAKQALARMLEAAETLDYQGTFVYIQGHHLEAMEISHRADRADDDSGWQHLSALNGIPREIIVTADSVICVLPGERIPCEGVSHRRSSFPISLPRDLDHLEAYYAFEVQGMDRTASHDTLVISIRPLDEFRFGYQFWVHQDSGMVLRSALIDEKDDVLEQLMFTEFEIRKPGELPAQAPRSDIESSADQQGSKPPEHTEVSVDSMPVQADDSHWRVGTLPPGFKKILHNRHGEAGASSVTEHIVLSDGLATVSVFLEALGPSGKPVLDGFSRMGAMNAFGFTRDDHQAMVVGEVPEEAVRAIAAALIHEH